LIISGPFVIAGDFGNPPLFSLSATFATRGLGARLSYDGHWLAYYDRNDLQLYVTSFPRPGARIAIAAGGYDPRWRADGQELYYVRKDRALMAAQVRETAQDFKVTSSYPLFRLSLPENVGFYDVTADGQRFLINTWTILSNPLR
jgi:eukaryotic-like serine/threonine-protein kinase